MERKNQYVLITEATQGAGYELAKWFAKQGYDLVMVARNHDELKVKADEFKNLGVHIITTAKNLFIPEDVYSLYSELKLNGISPEILVNNAGQDVCGKFQDTDIYREIDIVNLNIVSVIILTRLFLKDRLSKGSGKILNLVSEESKTSGSWRSVHHGTQAFIISWSESMRQELKDSGISITVLLSELADADFFNEVDIDMNEDIDRVISLKEGVINDFNTLNIER
ncbi:SDR family NAD(P)-dependent oxidoreductase [Chryseobacterium potabilaquae]|uniref:Ketoacyl reductase n=1 Tax=Chryseobacterium potabilaquae TaxID=2675057 RepID=A0A6N4XE16_9FLAO|nr:SDR family NAD(P)-dependent oxidoreductase [Chryseobacterium potabilaquae]CAA7196882.1 Putative ketoacyl reductase [Chryseobacterium potabilaquae]